MAAIVHRRGAVGQRVVDGVDVGVGHQLLVAVDHPRNRVLGGEVRACAVAGPTATTSTPLDPPGRPDNGGGAIAGGTEYADTEGGHDAAPYRLRADQ